jgi:intracellular septation protein A
MATMNLWTYTRRFQIDGQTYTAATRFDFKTLTSTLTRGTEVLAQDSTQYTEPGGQRNHRLQATLADGRTLAVTAGSISNWTVGIAVHLDGVLVHESHPGRKIEWPAWSRKIVENGHNAGDPAAAARATAEQQRQTEQWNRNKYSIFVDIALGLLFFAVAKFTNLTTAALVGAGAGLAIVVIQRFVRVDLLGGLAMFGIFMLLVSAGFSLVFDDEDMVKMKGTILGLFVAGLMLSDALGNGGRYFGVRMQRYILQPIDPARFTLGLGCVGLFMAVLNWLVARLASTDTWLFYTTFVDIVISVALFFAVLKFARRDDPAAPTAGGASPS